MRAVPRSLVAVVTTVVLACLCPALWAQHPLAIAAPLRDPSICRAPDGRYYLTGTTGLPGVPESHNALPRFNGCPACTTTGRSAIGI